MTQEYFVDLRFIKESLKGTHLPQQFKRSQILQILGPKDGKVVVCYIGTWSCYRDGAGKFTLDNIDPSLCTHLIYAFAGLDEANAAVISLGKRFDLLFSTMDN